MAVGGQLHEISMKIGELSEGVRNANESRQYIETLLTDINRNISTQNVIMTELRSDVTSVQADIAVMKPKIEKYEGMRNKVAGGVLVLSAISAAIGGAVAKMLPVLWK